MDYSQVQANMDELVKKFNTKMSEFEADFKQASRKNPGSIAALNTEFLAFKSFVCDGLSLLRAQVDALNRGVDRIEMRSRRKILLVHGIPEQKDVDAAARVATELTAKFSGVSLTSSSFRSCYRMGRIKDSKPRPIVVKFADCAVRDKLWKEKTVLRRSGITLSEFLTKSRHTVFKAAREKFGVKNCWTRDGIIYIKTSDDAKHKVETMPEFLAVPAPKNAA